jgi:catechol 2,3-dioxygenase-like lactoylglutathione lyase family enzyme
MDASSRHWSHTITRVLAIQQNSAHTPELFIFLAGGTAIGVRAPAEQTPASDAFDPFRVGLDHIALACADKAELRRVAEELTVAGVEHTGVKMDPTLQKEYLAFKDPDGMKWELYMTE